MDVERASMASSLIEVFDRVLDKGVVIDAWVRMSVACIDLLTVETRVVVASFTTYLEHADEYTCEEGDSGAYDDLAGTSRPRAAFSNGGQSSRRTLL